MNGQTQTWAQLLQRYGQQCFIGRQREQEVFRLNFIYQVPAYLIFAIHGLTGDGKSTLLNRYQAIAQTHGATSALINTDQVAATHQQTILHTMKSISRQLAQANTLLTTFEERYRQYTETLQMMVEDSETPAGVFDLLSGITKPAEAQAQAWDTYLDDKLMTPDQITLVKKPIQTLTQALVKDLGAWTTVRHIILSFDDWDSIGQHLGPWLRDWLASGDANSNLWIVIAGKSPLDAAWQHYYPLTATIALNAFTAGETRAYLSAHGFEHAERRSTIWTHSKGSPLLVSVLASTAGASDPTMPSPGLALNGMERYLQWLADAEQREIVLRCAAPRYLDADIAAVCTEDAAAFDWLSNTPLLVTHRGQHRYHPTLRDQVRELVQHQNLNSLRVAHTKLHAHYAAQLATFGSAPHYRDPQWRQYQLEYLYHGLMLKRGGAERDGLTLFLIALRAYYPLAGEIVRTWTQAAAAQTAPNSVTDWAATLNAAWAALERQDWAALLTFCTLVARRNDLSYAAQEELQSIRSLLQARQPSPAPVATPQPDIPLPLTTISDSGKQPVSASPHTQVKAHPIKETAAMQTDHLAKHPHYSAAHKSATAVNFSAPPSPSPASAPVLQTEPEALVKAETQAAPEIVTLPATLDSAQTPSEAAASTEIEIQSDIQPQPELQAAPEIVLEPETMTTSDSQPTSDNTPETVATTETDTATPPAVQAPPEVPPEPATSATVEAPATPMPPAVQAPPEVPPEPTTPATIVETPVTPETPATPTPPPEKQTAPAAIESADTPKIDAAEYTQRGSTHLGRGEYQKAIRDYTQAIALTPDYIAAYYNRALAFTQLRDFDHALEDYTQTLTLNPNFAAAYKNRGSIHARCKEYEHAIADYSQALRLKPADASIYNNRGNTYYNLEDYEHAITDYDHAIALNPNYTRAYLNRGLAYTSSAEYQQAIADYNQAIALNPDSATTYTYRGQAYARLAQHTHALADYDRALELAPNHPLIHNHRGLALVKLNRYAAGLAAYRRATELNPQYATAHYNAACAAALMGNAHTASDWLEKAIALHPPYQIMAQHDPDFKHVVGNLRFRNLVSPPQ